MKWLLIILLVLAVIFGFLNLNKNYKKVKQIKIGETVINVEVADTDEERVQGLSGREKLEEETGLLFVFEKEGNYGIWMKDMKFAIDIVWLDQNKKIVHIEEKVLPDSFPKVFNSSLPSLFVLETNVGFLRKNNIKIGDLVAF